MSEEPLVKDGALFFNAPDRKMSKPHVVYYDIAAQSTGIEYAKEEPDKKQATSTTLFKVLMSVGGIAVVMSILSVIYFFVVKLRKKENTPKESDLLDPDTEVSVVLPDIDKVLSQEYVENSHEQPPDNYDFITETFEKLHNGSVTPT